MTWVAIAAAGIGAAGAVGSSMISGSNSGGDGTTLTQEPMLTPEQKKAMSMLSNYAKTGQWGGGAYQAGEDYDGKLGEFQMTDTEKSGQDMLTKLMNTAGIGEMFDLGKTEIKDLLATDKYDPYSKTGVYGGYKKNVLREEQESSDRLKRDLAVTGDLYSTNTGKEMGLLKERSQDQLSSKLAELYDVYGQRKLQGAETAAQMGIQEQQSEVGKIGLSQSLGSLDRLLKDAEAKTKYADWIRGREEWRDTVSSAITT